MVFDHESGSSPDLGFSNLYISIYLYIICDRCNACPVSQIINVNMGYENIIVKHVVVPHYVNMEK